MSNRRTTLACCLLGSILMAAPVADAQTLMREQYSLGGQSFNSFQWVNDVGDLDGDGVHDLSVVLPSVQMGVGVFGPVLSLVSGRQRISAAVSCEEVLDNRGRGVPAGDHRTLQ